MSGVGETVLLSLSGVVHRKQEGVVRVTANRLLFTSLQNKQLSIGRDSITACNASRSSTKAQVVAPQKSYVFVFADQAACDSFVETMHSAAPAAAAAPPPIITTIANAEGASSEAHIRAQILSRDPKLRRAYEEVVEQSKLISSAEFWRSRQHMLDLERHSTESQQVGLSSGMLEAVQPEIQQGSSGISVGGASTGSVSYKLSGNIIAQILAKHPAVARAYQDHVPDKLSEQQFWTKYFQSQYFKRARVQFVGSENTDAATAALQPMHDIFSQFEQESEPQPRESSEMDSLKPVVDIQRLNDLTLDEPRELNSTQRQESIAGGIRSTPSLRDRERHDLIREFNLHSKVVLGTAGPRRSSLDVITSPAISEPDIPVHVLNIARASNRAPRTHESTEVPESPAIAGQFCSDLRAVLQASRAPTLQTTVPTVMSVLSHQCRTTDRQVVVTQQSKFVMFSQDKADEVVPDKLLDAVRSRSIKCTELLRHFWSCFPITTESRVRLERIKESLVALDHDIKKMRTKLHEHDCSVFVKLFDPSTKMLQTAAERSDRIKQQAIAPSSGDTSQRDPKRIRLN